MELFYSKTIVNLKGESIGDLEPEIGNFCILDSAESVHCTRVLRHSDGDIINIIDGRGNMLECRLVLGKKEQRAEILSIKSNFGDHNYFLTMAVCPTKNIDRYEWFLEKATEIGADEFVPVIGEHSQRRRLNTERLEKILISASKQSLKAFVPKLKGDISVLDFIKDCKANIKLIAHCNGDNRCAIWDALNNKKVLPEIDNALNTVSDKESIAILIGPEGDFSNTEINYARERGFIAVHLGESRLRTETAAMLAASSVYMIKHK